MDILDIFLDILLKPPQPLMGLFSKITNKNEWQNNPECKCYAWHASEDHIKAYINSWNHK